MKQTIEEMKAALDAFERDGVVEFKIHTGIAWMKTPLPRWDFNVAEYRPCPPKPAAPQPAYLSKATLDQLYQRLLAESCIIEGQMVSMIITDAKAHNLLLQDHLKTK